MNIKCTRTSKRSNQVPLSAANNTGCRFQDAYFKNQIREQIIKIERKFQHIKSPKKYNLLFSQQVYFNKLYLKNMGRKREGKLYFWEEGGGKLCDN